MSWEPGVPVDLTVDGRGVVAALVPGDLNANVVAWPAGEGVGEHVNAERDVLVVVLGGGVTVTVDDASEVVSADQAILIPKGVRRSLLAGTDGARYLTVHVRREPLSVDSPARDSKNAAASSGEGRVSM